MARSNRLTKEEIKHDQFIESTLKSYTFLKDNLKSIIIAVAVVIIAIAVVWAYQNRQQTQRADASSAFNRALEKHQEAEESWLDAEKVDEIREQLQAAGAQFQEVFQKYSRTPFADKARYNYAKTLYHLEDYQGARTQFQSVIEKHVAENQILALYAQEAIGNCYEQEGKYEEAIQAYQEKVYPPTPQLPVTVRGFALANAKFNQALCYEKLGQTDEALALYGDLVDKFRDNLKKAIQQKSLELIPEVKKLIDNIPEPLALLEAQRLANEGQYYDAFVAYFDAIRE